MTLGVAASVLGAAMFPPAVVKAAPVISITPQGTSHDNAGDTADGFTSYVLTATADVGDVIDAFDLGSGTSTTGNGIFGPLLQDWAPAKTGATPTPTETDQNGGAYGIDSHILTASADQVAPPGSGPSEDNNLVHPTGAPANDTFDSYGTGTYLHGIFGLANTAQAPIVQFAYVVLPTGSVANYTVGVAEEPAGTTGSTTYQISGSVPEPVSASLACLGASAFLIRRTRRSTTV